MRYGRPIAQIVPCRRMRMRRVDIVITYHDAVVEIRSPDLKRSKRFLDFGPAFYVTTFMLAAVMAEN